MHAAASAAAVGVQEPPRVSVPPKTVPTSGGVNGGLPHGLAAAASATAAGLLPVDGVLFLRVRGLIGECANANDAPVALDKLLRLSAVAGPRALLLLALPLLLSGLGKGG